MCKSVPFFILLIFLSFNTLDTLAQSAKIAIEFMSRNELIWAQYKANKSQLDNLYTALNSSIEQIKQKKLKIQILSAATSFDNSDDNKNLAFKRSRQLVTLLAGKYKIDEDCFSVTTATTPMLDKPDVAIISIISTNTPATTAKQTTAIAKIEPVKTVETKPATQSSTKTATKKNTKKEAEQSNEQIPEKLSPILTNIQPDSTPRNFLKPPAAPKSPQHKYSL